MIPNQNLTPVPDKDSLMQIVEQEWVRLQRALYDDMPYEATIRGIEEAIATRKELVESRALNPNFDWQYDLDRAVFHHRFNLTWIDHHKGARARYFDYWRSTTAKNSAYLREIALNGMKSMLLIHGGVAVGALGVLTQKTVGSQVLLTAKFALGFALVGMFMLGFGQMIMVNRVMNLNSRLEGKLSGRWNWKKLTAFSRYFGRYSWPIKYSDWMIYGSILWFGIYSTILYIMLVWS